MRSRLPALVCALALLAAACGGGGATDVTSTADDGPSPDAAMTSSDRTLEEHAGHSPDEHEASTDPASGAVAQVAGRQLQQTLIPNPDVTGYQGAVLNQPVPKPDFTLTDTEGEPFDFIAETADDAVTMLYFGYTTCPDVCPGHMAAAASALREVEEAVAEDVSLVFVSVDPERDGVDPESSQCSGETLLRCYLDSFDPSFTGLIGTPTEVNQIMAGMGLDPSAIAADGDYPPSHPVNIIAFTGDEARIAYPHGVNGADIAQDLPGLVSEGVTTT